MGGMGGGGGGMGGSWSGRPGEGRGLEPDLGSRAPEAPRDRALSRLLPLGRGGPYATGGHTPGQEGDLPGLGRGPLGPLLSGSLAWTLERIPWTLNLWLCNRKSFNFLKG